MPPHPRTRLRAALAESLAAHGLAVCRSDPPDSLPAVRLLGGAEDIAEASYPLAGERGFLRRCYHVVLECLVPPGGQAEDDLDALAARVERALQATRITSVDHASVRLLHSAPPELETAPARRRLTVQIRYFTAYP